KILEIGTVRVDDELAVRPERLNAADTHVLANRRVAFELDDRQEAARLTGARELAQVELLEADRLEADDLDGELVGDFVDVVDNLRLRPLTGAHFEQV